MELLEGPDLFDYLAARSCKLKEMEAICLVRRGGPQRVGFNGGGCVFTGGLKGQGSKKTPQQRLERVDSYALDAWMP